MRNVKAALDMQAQGFPEAWALLALLLATQEQHGLAASCVDAALPGLPPDRLQLLLSIKARILAASGAEIAKQTAHQIDCSARFEPGCPGPCSVIFCTWDITHSPGYS